MRASACTYTLLGGCVHTCMLCECMRIKCVYYFAVSNSKNITAGEHTETHLSLKSIHILCVLSEIKVTSAAQDRSFPFFLPSKSAIWPKGSSKQPNTCCCSFLVIKLDHFSPSFHHKVQQKSVPFSCIQNSSVIVSIPFSTDITDSLTIFLFCTMKNNLPAETQCLWTHSTL